MRLLRSSLEIQSVYIVGLLPIHALRSAVLRFWRAKLAPRVTIYHGLQARGCGGIEIGDRTIIGDNASLDGRGGLRIGRNVNISSGVQIWTAQHDWKSRDFSYVQAPVSIGDRAWIGPNVTILPGCTVGQGTVVAAGAVARGTMEPFSLYGGVPAKLISRRRIDIDYDLATPRKKLWWW